MARFFQVVWLVVRKDLRVESRSWEMVSTTLFFAVSCVLVFAFAFVREGRALDGAAPGILWITVAFSGTLALGRAFERERYQDALRGLLMAPVERSAIYCGKLLGIIMLMAAVELVVVAAVSLTFQAPLLRHAVAISSACSTAGTRWLRLVSAPCSRRCCCGRRVEGCCCRSSSIRWPRSPCLIAGVGGTRGASCRRIRTWTWPVSGWPCFCSSTWSSS